MGKKFIFPKIDFNKPYNLLALVLLVVLVTNVYGDINSEEPIIDPPTTDPPVNDPPTTDPPITSLTYIGISSIPRQQSSSSPYALSSIDEVIAVINSENLNVWRMTFEYDDYRFPIYMQDQYIQYFLDNCDAELIIEYYHKGGYAYMTTSDWQTTTQRGIDLSQKFSNYHNRIYLEPYNEKRNSDLGARTQDYVTALRNAGFTGGIVANVFWDSDRLLELANVNDPLDKFYVGQHIYLYAGGELIWNLGGGYGNDAYAWMNEGLAAGLKIINTEVGCDANGQAYFTASRVQEFNQFLEWCYDKDIGNTVWLMYGDYDYPKYKELGLTFPN